MTIETFARAVRALDLTWHKQGISSIRCATGDCPILALGRARGMLTAGDMNSDWCSVGHRLGLTRTDALMIIGAADRSGVGGTRRGKLRARFERWLP